MAYQFPFLQQYLLRTFSDLRILLDSGDTVVNTLYRCVCVRACTCTKNNKDASENENNRI